MGSLIVLNHVVRDIIELLAGTILRRTVAVRDVDPDLIGIRCLEREAPDFVVLGGISFDLVLVRTREQEAVELVVRRQVVLNQIPPVTVDAMAAVVAQMANAADYGRFIDDGFGQALKAEASERHIRRELAC